MSSFVGIPPFSKLLLVDMETMHFHIAHTNVFLEQLRFAFRGPNEQVGTSEKLSLGCKVT